MTDESLPAFISHKDTLSQSEVYNTIVNYTSDSSLSESSIAFIKSSISTGSAYCVANAINTRFGTNIMIDCNKDLNEDMKALLEERVDTIVADKKKWKGDKSFLTGRNLVLIDNDAQMLLDAAQIEKLEGRM